jgi:hypothetical protein
MTRTEELLREFVQKCRADLYYSEQDGFMITDLNALLDKLMPAGEEVDKQYPTSYDGLRIQLRLGNLITPELTDILQGLAESNKKIIAGIEWFRSRMKGESK